jgi:guanosine-3',5'-bis(diphosphate) 3'-pyrophosphohydrolase
MDNLILNDDSLKQIFDALQFSADKHRKLKRKNKHATPYINHPIDVARILVTVGGVNDTDIICAALLHDTIEDTQTTEKEIEDIFGTKVKDYVVELTDNMELSADRRKEMQAKSFPHKSTGAKLIKLCDKISNVSDVIHDPPVFWTHSRRLRYLDSAEQLLDAIRGTNENLERKLDEIIAEGREFI